jgi:hypothetical protein
MCIASERRKAGASTLNNSEMHGKAIALLPRTTLAKHTHYLLDIKTSYKCG